MALPQWLPVQTNREASAPAALHGIIWALSEEHHMPSGLAIQGGAMYSGGSSGSSGKQTGLSPRAAGALCYLPFLVTGVLFLFIEKNNRFVRFHAWQSILLFVGYTGIYTVVSVAGSILEILPLIGGPLWYVSRVILSLMSFVMGIATIYLMMQAAKEQRTKLPYLGDVAERNAYL